MIEIGSVIRARLVGVEPYGVYLQHGDDQVIVLAPEVSWLDKGDLRERVRVGDVFDVLALRYNYQKLEIVGSIRRLHPEENPYRQLSRLPPSAILQGKVVMVYGDGATVQLANGARGHIPRYTFGPEELRPGEDVPVTIAALAVDEGALTLNLVRPGDESAERTASPMLAESTG